MTQTTFTVTVPDIGGTAVDVIEVLVKVGDVVTLDQSLLTLEGDKATMDIPSPQAGKVQDILVSVGDKVSEGDAIVTLVIESAADDAAQSEKDSQQPADKTSEKTAKPSRQAVVIPDIGGAAGVQVIEWVVSVGDTVQADDTLLTLEGDKATMDVPSPFAGTVDSCDVAVGDTVSEGDVVAHIMAVATETESAPAPTVASAAPQSTMPLDDTRDRVEQLEDLDAGDVPDYYSLADIYAGPAVRRLAREFGVDLALVKGTGAKKRITKNDLQNYVRRRMQGGAGEGGGLAVIDAPKVDYARFGEVETVELSRIQKLSGGHLHRNWVTIPHVTQFGAADITDLESFRQANKKAALAQGARLTPLAFIMKAAVMALQKFPRMNASLNDKADALVIKKYFHIGVAVDTPAGLVVAVVRDVDQKSAIELAKELAEISTKAREKGLAPAEMQGSTFTISSLGGIGGTAFTPIVNAPNVGILGVSKSSQQPVYDGKEFAPRLMLPLSLSYDHRVIDGAVGARFIVALQDILAGADLRTL